MSDNAALMKAFARISRDEHRARIVKAVRVVKAMRKAGEPIKAVIVDGVEVRFGAPETAPATFNEWDRDLYGKHPAQIRQ
jgi:hypothetical protein